MYYISGCLGIHKLHLISHKKSRLACSYQKWLALTKIVSIGMHVHIHIDHPKGNLDVHQSSASAHLCCDHVFLLTIHLQYNLSGRNSCAMSVLVTHNKAKWRNWVHFIILYISLLALISIHCQQVPPERILPRHLDCIIVPDKPPWVPFVYDFSKCVMMTSPYFPSLYLDSPMAPYRIHSSIGTEMLCSFPSFNKYFLSKSSWSTMICSAASNFSEHFLRLSIDLLWNQCLMLQIVCQIRKVSTTGSHVRKSSWGRVLHNGCPEPSFRHDDSVLRLV